MDYLRRLVRDRRGTASIEAAILLPLMALCWTALFFRFQGIEQELDAAVEARKDAWVFSAQGCEKGPNDPDIPAGIAVNCNQDGPDWMSAVSKIPFVGWLISSIAGFELTKVAKREHPVPNLLGGGTSHMAYPYALMCNEKDRDLDYILTSCICQQVSALGLSLNFAVPCPPQPSRDGASCQ
jgi:Flp pilus assembly pilin Flp